MGWVLWKNKMNKDMKKVGELDIQIPGGRAFQAEEITTAKALKQKYI